MTEPVTRLTRDVVLRTRPTQALRDAVDHLLDMRTADNAVRVDEELEALRAEFARRDAVAKLYPGRT